MKRLFLILLLLASPSFADLPHGIAVGDVSSTSVVLWAGADAAGEVVFEIDEDPSFETPQAFRAAAQASRDFTAQVVIDELRPNTKYHVRVRHGGSEATGSFRTAPESDQLEAVHFLVGGDVGGQAYCRHVDDGYAIFRPMKELGADFLLVNGDMIYADGACPAKGPGGWPNVPGDFPSILDPALDWASPATREAIYAHWRYNRSDEHLQAFSATTPIYAQWDDHEVINDFGASWTSVPFDERPGFPELVAAGRNALFHYSPIAPNPDEPQRIYRSFRRGRGAEFFLLDGRSYRDRNDQPERPGESKTMLGAEQLEWLKKGLASSDAEWKIISSNIPLSVPTGSQADRWGRDGWANGDGGFDLTGFSIRTGFERELHELLAFLDTEDIKNVVFVVTDVHFAMNLRYVVDVDGDGDELLFHELLSGPLNAYRLATGPQLDPTFKPTILYAEGDLFNFLRVVIEPAGGGSFKLTSETYGVDGEVRFGSRLQLASE